MPDCPYCTDGFKCKNDVLQHIVIEHNANMERWPP